MVHVDGCFLQTIMKNWLDPTTCSKVKFIKREQMEKWIPQDAVAA